MAITNLSLIFCSDNLVPVFKLDWGAPLGWTVILPYPSWWSDVKLAHDYLHKHEMEMNVEWKAILKVFLKECHLTKKTTGPFIMACRLTFPDCLSVMAARKKVPLSCSDICINIIQLVTLIPNTIGVVKVEDWLWASIHRTWVLSGIESSVNVKVVLACTIWLLRT